MSENQSISSAYVAYSTFKNTILGLAPEGELPARIDHSVLSSMSGSARTQFVGALKFFGLVDEGGVPSEALKKLALSNEQEWKTTFKGVLEKHYDSAILEALRAGTPKSLHEAFSDDYPSIVKPATRFLLKAAQDVGVSVGAHIAKAKTNGDGNAPRRAPRKSGARRREPVPQPQAHFEGDIKSALLAKFPTFNPKWKDEQQEAWFAAYQKLLAITGTKGGGGDDA